MNILLFLCQHCYGIWIFQLLCYFYVQTAMLSLCLYCNAISMFILLSDCYVHTATLSLFSNYNVIYMFKLLCYFYVQTAMLSLCPYCYGIWFFQLLSYLFFHTAMLFPCSNCNAFAMFLLLYISMLKLQCYLCVYTAKRLLCSYCYAISIFKLQCYFYVQTAMLFLCLYCNAISMSTVLCYLYEFMLFLPMMPTACSCRLRCGKLQRSRSNFVRIWTERIVLDSTNIVGLVFAVLKWQQEIVLVFFKKMGHPRPLLSFIFNIFKQTLPFLQWYPVP